MQQMTDEQKKRVEDNIPLAMFITKKWAAKNVPIDFEELFSLCSLALCKASRIFDPERGLAFATLAVKCMDNEVLLSLRGQKRRPVTSLNEALAVDQDGNTLAREDTLASNDHLSYEQIEVWEALKKLVNDLSLKELQVIWYYFFDKGAGNQRNIADKLGLSQSYVSRIRRNALNKMSKRLRERGA